MLLHTSFHPSSFPLIIVLLVMASRPLLVKGERYWELLFFFTLLRRFVMVESVLMVQMKVVMLRCRRLLAYR
ncbi:hypothetical protein EON65_46160 [archaeon]|nr:MAG: hypothetical protein EON65_46160 [archaeon]